VFRLFRHHVPGPLLALGLLELALLFLAAEAAWHIRVSQIGDEPTATVGRLPQLATFALITWFAMLAVGVYHFRSYRSLRIAAVRLAAAIALAIMVLALVFFLLPDVALWRSVSLYAVVLSFVLILAGRALFKRLVGSNRLRRRVLVVGAGDRAARLEALAGSPHAGFTITRFVRMTDRPHAVSQCTSRDELGGLVECVQRDEAEEVVVALEERRGSLPIDDLIAVRLAGIPVTEMSTFLEAETGRVDLDSVSPSWLIFSDGFLGAQRLATIGKRGFDIVAASAGLLVFSPIILVAGLVVLLTSPGGVFYRQQRVGQGGSPFELVKLRSMRSDAEKDGAKWAQRNDPRITPVGRFIRLTRIDEMPQLWCVLKGDMSFVGPRPERPEFVSDLAKAIPYYNERHVVKPGVTGWAQINYPYGASVEDARAKLEYDLYYIKNYSMALDLFILLQTVRVVLWQDGSR
jgi:sugar transferase (PEP-CTERM system associated)